MATHEKPFYIDIPAKLTPEEQQILMELELDAFPGLGAVDEQTLVPLARYGKIILYKEEGDPRPVAVCELMRDYHSPSKAYIFGYYVRSDKKGQGIGKKFMAEVHSIVKKDGFSKICLTVSLENKAAVTLYEKSGYQIVETRKSEFGAGEDRYYMERLL
ncbi:ribosomal protein S18 acetylase RimI-like enzyme [Peribacillus deserti]|uniref:Ribosomal protein S18 acetylase RimI-like enzyme n=1 Tax=Peribacillus deserti TaxID=673318 RepID=A0ABS2QDH9_9BACI|nr:GNAT family N-acetyltransferase [Peribacillus deserti]MBM7691194.1 ribosomal protein S18 acetylase RimI-like enzyme [Peribacillus deserti]